MVAAGIEATGLEEVGLLSLSSADHSRSARSRTSWPTATTAPTSRCRSRARASTPSTSTWPTSSRANGRRSGLTFAPEGGSQRLRQVINKMVTDEDLIRTVSAGTRAAGAGQALLHVRSADETDEGVARDRRPGAPGDRHRPQGQRPARHPLHGEHRRLRAQAAHTPFQWAAQCDADVIDEPACASCGRRCSPTASTARRSASATTTASPAWSRACSAAVTAGFGRVIEAVWRDGGRFDGWSETSRTSAGCAAPRGAGRHRGGRRLVHHPRARPQRGSCPGTTSNPASTASGCGRTGRTPSTSARFEDCRWTPCFDCGVCPQMDTSIQIGPTGRTLLPIAGVRQGVTWRQLPRRGGLRALGCGPWSPSPRPVLPPRPPSARSTSSSRWWGSRTRSPPHKVQDRLHACTGSGWRRRPSACWRPPTPTATSTPRQGRPGRAARARDRRGDHPPSPSVPATGASTATRTCCPTRTSGLLFMVPGPRRHAARVNGPRAAGFDARGSTRWRSRAAARSSGS